MKTSVSANSRCVPRKIIASGGPNAATYMWYSDIDTAISVTASARARRDFGLRRERFVGDRSGAVSLRGQGPLRPHHSAPTSL